MKKFLIPVGIILVIAFGTVGYGFLNGYRIQSYAKKVEEIWSEDEKKWNEANFKDVDMENVSVEDEINRTKKDLKNSLDKINTLSASGKAKTLESDIKGYYSEGISVIEKSEVFLIYLSSYAKVTNDMTKITEATESSSEFAAQSTEFRKTIDGDKGKMAKIEVPQSYTGFHSQFVALLDEFSVLLDKAIGYVNEGQLGMVEGLNFDFNLLMMRLILIEYPSEAPEEMMTNEDGKRLEALGNKIKAEMDVLKKLKFVLW